MHSIALQKQLLLCSFIIVLAARISFAQYKYDYQWPYAEEDTNDAPWSTILDFNHGQVKHYSTSLKSTLWWSRGSICDPRTGRLLYYTNGCDIRDSSTHIMLNGDGLNPGEVRDIYCKEPDGSYISGPHIFLPFEHRPDRYILVHATVSNLDTFPYLETYRLNYTVIDARGNKGLGKVIKKNIPIYIDSVYILSIEKMNAVRHSNLKDWWVVNTLDIGTQGFLLSLIADTGVILTKRQFIGPDNNSDKGGWISFSPDGSLLAAYTPLVGLAIYDFDRTSGALSNYRLYSIPEEEREPQSVFGGCAFSGSGRFLYINDATHIWQFDLQAGDIGASRVLVAEWDRFRDEKDHTPVSFLYQERGPDCRIYVSPASSSRYSGVILYPDRKGEACMMRQHSIRFEFTKSHGQFLFPNYRLGLAPTCDSTIGITLLGTRTPYIEPLYALASPNPLRDRLYIDLTGAAAYPVRVDVHSMEGTPVLSTTLRQENNEIHTSAWSPGSYVIRLRDARGRIFSNKLIKLP